MAAAVLAGCSQTNPDDPDGNPAFGGEEPVRIKVNAEMEGAEMVQAYEMVSPFAETKTVLNYANHPIEGVTQHPVVWRAGDKLYSYAASGVYMNYDLVADDLNALSGNKKCKYEVLYRVGDPWVTSYCKGTKIGEHIGYRTKGGLTLSNGVPREQNGVFENYHICMAQENPENEEFLFHNMQAYVRFEVSGKLLDGKLVGKPINRITIISNSGEKMAGNQVIQDVDGTWRCSVEDSGIEADKTITVDPDGGAFQPSVKNASGDTVIKNYFVAVPVRRYGKGIRLNLFTKLTSGAYEQKGYIETPSFTLSGNQILECSDLLLYVVIFVEKIQFEYPAGTNPLALENEIPGAGISIVVGHTANIGTYITPLDATNQVLNWEVISGAEYVSIAPDGAVTGLKVSGTSTATVKASAVDGSGIYGTYKVKVTPAAVPSAGPKTSSPGVYEPSKYSW